MFRWITLISAVVFVIALAGTILSSEKPIEPSNQPATEKSEKGHATEKKEKALFDRWFPNSNVIFNLFVAIFTGLLAFGGLYQLKILTRAERIASDTAKAAKQSADVAKDALITGNRAFVMLSGNSFLWHKNEDGSFWWEISPIWLNAGNTRTDSLRVNVNSYFEDTALPIDWHFPPYPGESTDFFLGPKQPGGSDPIIKTGSELAAVNAGTKKLYIWGSARYRDVFDGTPEHVTRFAWQIFIFGDPTKPGTSESGDNVVRLTTKLLKQHNCADDECIKQGFP